MSLHLDLQWISLALYSPVYPRLLTRVGIWVKANLGSCQQTPMGVAYSAVNLINIPLFGLLDKPYISKSLSVLVN